MTLITGNTYPVKDQLKALGGRWDSVAKGWKVPDDKAEEARKLVGGPATAATNATPRATCAECGKGGRLVRDMEDGMYKHYKCCDMPPGGY